MNILLHACCAPCSNAPLHSLREEGISPSIFWFNPNIHPYQEYKSRKNSLIQFSKEQNYPLILEDDYGLRSFVQAVADNIDGRCPYCYLVRLERTAQVAKAEGFEGFTTSLLISPYQNHGLLQKIGEEMGEKYDIPFLYRDFRPLFRDSLDYARSQEYYMQKYCGCVFSEEDRYNKKLQKERVKAAKACMKETSAP